MHNNELLPIDVLLHPFDHIDELQDALGSFYLYGPNDPCPFFEYTIPGIISYDKPMYCIKSGIIDVKRYKKKCTTQCLFSIIYERNIKEYMHTIYKDSVYPSITAIDNMTTLILDCEYYEYCKTEIAGVLHHKDDLIELYTNIISNIKQIISLLDHVAKSNLYSVILRNSANSSVYTLYSEKKDEIDKIIGRITAEIYTNDNKIRKMQQKLGKKVHSIKDIFATSHDVIHLPYTNPEISSKLSLEAGVFPLFHPISTQFHSNRSSLQNFLKDYSFTISQEDLCYANKGVYFNFVCRARPGPSSYFYSADPHISLPPLDSLSPTTHKKRQNIHDLFKNMLRNTLRQKQLTADKNYNANTVTRNAKRLKRVKKLYHIKPILDIDPDVRRTCTSLLRKINTLLELAIVVRKKLVESIRKPYTSIHLGEMIYLFIESGKCNADHLSIIIYYIMEEIKHIKVDVYRTPVYHYAVKNICEACNLLIYTKCIKIFDVLNAIVHCTEETVLTSADEKMIFTYIEKHCS